MTLFVALFEALWRAFFVALLQHLPQIQQALTPTAREAADDPEHQAQLEADQDTAINDGVLPSVDDLGR